MSRSLFGHFVLEIPDPVPMRELLMSGSTFGQDPALEARHGEQEVGVVLGVDGHEACFPFNGCHRSLKNRKTMLKKSLSF